MPKFSTVFFIFFLSFLFATASGQTVQDEYLEEKIEVHEFNEERWKTLSEDIDYSNEKREKEEPEPEPDKSGDRASGSDEKSGAAGFFEIIKYIVLIGAIALVIFLLVKLLGKDGPTNRKINPVSEMELEEIEENLESAELDDPLRRAIASGDYTLAVRLYYLALLKELSAKKLIRWKRDKTNGEYMRELIGHSFSNPFRDVTLIFERIWYGDVELNKDEFLKIEEQLKKAISTAESQAPAE
jgi:hypothetical protein